MVLTINQLSLGWIILVLISTHTMTGSVNGQSAANLSEEYFKCMYKHVSLGHYKCTNEGKECLPGWKGVRCDQAICTEGCRNGTCELPGTCNCNDGYEGVHCDECKVFPGCKHGSCNEPWECNCEEGWGGRSCDKDMAYCSRHRPCVNGICHNKSGKYFCECPSDFTGTNCDIPINDCSSSPCLNNGTCTQDTSTSNYTCTCLSGFTGPNCEAQYSVLYQRCFVEGYQKYEPSSSAGCNYIEVTPELKNLLVDIELINLCQTILKAGCSLSSESYSCSRGVNQVLVSAVSWDNYGDSRCCRECRKGLSDALLFGKCPSFTSGQRSLPERARLYCCRTKVPNPNHELFGLLEPDYMRPQEIYEIMRANGIVERSTLRMNLHRTI